MSEVGSKIIREMAEKYGPIPEAFSFGDGIDWSSPLAKPDRARLRDYGVLKSVGRAALAPRFSAEIQNGQIVLRSLASSLPLLPDTENPPGTE